MPGEDGILVGVAGLVLEDQPVGRDSERREQAGCSVGIALAIEKEFACAARDDHFRTGKVPGKDRRLDHAVAAAVQLVAATHQIDGALEAAAEHDDAVDLLRQRRPGKALFKRIEHHGAERGPGRQREDQEGQHAAGSEQSFAPEQGGEQSGQQQEDRQVQGLDEEPEDLGKIEEHPSPHYSAARPRTRKGRCNTLILR
ncbi:hypothetical protein AJ88_04770 [Mesorhizobium amorphae CCBAU 01583]|nr:hypothetical protein AJ88_04770 [Mesorhizobium amorphae CCBAU 01583]